jgi:hypothetical protein
MPSHVQKTLWWGCLEVTDISDRAGRLFSLRNTCVFDTSSEGTALCIKRVRLILPAKYALE